MCKIMKEQGLKLILLTPSPCPWHYFSRTLIVRRERVKKISQWISKYLIIVAQIQGFSCSWLHSHYWDPSYCYFCLLWPSLWSGFSLNLGLEFWPCCLTSWKACFPLVRSCLSHLGKQLHPRALSSLPRCLCPHACRGPSLIHTQPGCRPWAVVVRSPLSVPSTEIDRHQHLCLLIHTLPLSHSDSCRSLLNQQADLLGLRHKHPSFIQYEMRCRVEWVPGYFQDYFNNTLFIWHHQGVR